MLEAHQSLKERDALWAEPTQITFEMFGDQGYYIYMEQV